MKKFFGILCFLLAMSFSFKAFAENKAGTNKLGGIIAHQELYFGYALKYNNLYVALAGGIWGGAGVTFYKLEENSNLKTEINFLILFGIRNDYMYFFNQKIGFSFSHTHGFGVHYGRWVLDDRIRYYSFLIKTAVAFRI